MTDKKYLAYYRVAVDVRLAEGDLRDARRKLNVHYTGRPTIDIEDSKEISTPHREAHYSMVMPREMTMDVGLLPDGSIEPITIVDEDNDRGQWWFTWKGYDEHG